jgi:hypothetical protein
MPPSVDDTFPLSMIDETSMFGLAFDDLEPPLPESLSDILSYHFDDSNLFTSNTQEWQLFSPPDTSRIMLDTPMEMAGASLIGPSGGDLSDTIAHVDIDGDHGLVTGRAVVGEQGLTGDSVQQSDNTKRKASMARTEESLKKTRRQQEQRHRCDAEPPFFKSYVKLEEQKCLRLGIDYNQQQYLHTTVVEWISRLDKGREKDALSMISVAIGSSESIANLQHIVREGRGKAGQIKPSETLDPAARVREIQQLSGQIAFIEFLRRCHVWKLYSDLSDVNQSSSYGFDIATPESMSQQITRKAGNPNFIRTAEITKAMMLCGLAPEVARDPRTYDKQYRIYTKLRKLGERLQLLTETFGFGVLGLIPTQDVSDGGDLVVRLSDEMWVPFVCTMTK